MAIQFKFGRRRFLRMASGIAVLGTAGSLLGCLDPQPSDPQPSDPQPSDPQKRSEPPLRTFYISPDGDDTNSGSIESPWATVNHPLKPGDLVYFRHGRYQQRIALPHSGARGAPITISGYPGERAVIEGESGMLHIVEIDGRSDIVIENLDIAFSPAHADPQMKWGWVTVSYSDRIILRNLRIRKEADPFMDYEQGYQESAIEIDSADDVEVDSCRIQGMNKGIGVRNRCRNTHIHHNVINGTVQSCIVMATSLNTLRGALIEDNVLEGSVIEDGIQFMPDYDAQDVALDTSNLGTTVRNNIIRNNNENAIDLKGTRYITIEGNIIYGTIGSNNGNLNGWNRDSLFAIGRGSNTECRDILIRHNVIYDNANGIWIDGENNKIYNNTIIYNNRDYTGRDSDWISRNAPNFYGLRHRYSGQRNSGIRNNLVGGHVRGGQIAPRLTEAESVDIDHNIYFAGAVGAGYLTDYRGRATWDTYEFAPWQQFLAAQSNVAGKDRNSRFVPFADVAFVNVPERPSGDHTQFDFSIRSESAAYQAGGPLTTASDAGRESTLLPVEDATWFSDGYGSSLVDGDTITVGADTVQIVSIDRTAGTLTLDRPISWSRSTPVYFGPSARPDAGAEFFA